MATSRRDFLMLAASALPVAGVLAGCASDARAAGPARDGSASPRPAAASAEAAASTPPTPAVPATTPPPSRPGLVALDDYPWPGINSHIRSETSGVGADAGTWGMVYGGCVSYAAWKIYEDNGGTQRPPKIPAPGWFPGDGLAKSPVRSSWGGAATWAAAVRGAGYRVDTAPRLGSFALWPVSSAFPLGFVAYVTAVNPDGSLDTAQYNLRRDATFSTARLARTGGVDAYDGRPPVAVAWPQSFLHISAGS